MIRYYKVTKNNDNDKSRWNLNLIWKVVDNNKYYYSFGGKFHRYCRVPEWTNRMKNTKELSKEDIFLEMV